MKHEAKLNGKIVEIPNRCSACNRKLNVNKSWTLYPQMSEFFEAMNGWWVNKNYPTGKTILFPGAHDSKIILVFCDWTCEFLDEMDLWLIGPELYPSMKR